MNGQINFLEEMEEREEKDRIFREKTEMYQKWLVLPEKMLVCEGTPERERLSQTLWEGYCKLYRTARHECPGIPDDKYIWMNPCENNYWVLHTKSEVSGEHIQACPYCGANLADGKGDATLYKAEPRYWLFYLHFDVPMREKGYQPEEDRKAIKEVWG